MDNNINRYTLWRQKATITAAVLVNLMGVYSLYTLHRSGFFVIPESEAVTTSDAISANSSCTAVNDLIAPLSWTANIVPNIATDGSVNSITGSMSITGPVDGDGTTLIPTGTMSWSSNATKLSAYMMVEGFSMVHAAGCQNISNIGTTASNMLASVDTSSTPFVLMIGSASVSAASSLTTITVPPIDLYSGVNVHIGDVDPATKSFVKYGTSGGAGVNIAYRIGMQRTVGISATNVAQSRTLTFTSNVVE